MILTIGLKDNSRELKVKTELDEAAVREALLGAGEQFVEFEQEDGAKLLVNPSAIAYVEFGKNKPRSVGFGAS